PKSAGIKERRTDHRLPEAVITVLQALFIVLVTRSFLFQPFNIPSGSMEPTLLVGDDLFVSKFSYGFGRYSLPFSPPLFSGRVLAAWPDRGDIVVFRRGADDFIKRLIGRPGDRIQLVDGVIFINGTPVERHRIADFVGRDPCRPAPPIACPFE